MPAGRRRSARGPAPEESRAARAERRARSIEEPLDVRLRPGDVYPILEVRNPLHGTSYRVLLPEYPSRSSALCTCADFARRGLGTCKHIEAAFRWRNEHPEASAPLSRDPRAPRTAGLWKEIDRRLASASRTAGPDRRRWRWAGSALFEPTETLR